MHALNRLADQLDEVATVLAGARPDDLDPGAAVAGQDLPGVLGEVAAALHRQRSAALHARAREAESAAAALGMLAADLRTAAAGYAGADEAARTGVARVEDR